MSLRELTHRGEKHTFAGLILGLLTDAGEFGYSTVKDGKVVEPDKRERRASEAWANDLSRRPPEDCLRYAIAKYRRAYPYFRSPEGRPFPDHYYRGSVPEVREIIDRVLPPKDPDCFALMKGGAA